MRDENAEQTHQSVHSHSVLPNILMALEVLKDISIVAPHRDHSRQIAELIARAEEWKDVIVLQPDPSQPVIV